MMTDQNDTSLEVGKQSIPNASPIGIAPFKIDRALVGLELDAMDEVLLRYLNFLSENIEIKAPYFLHVLPKYTSLDPFFEWEDKKYVRDELLEKSVEKELIQNVATALAKVHSIKPEYQLAHGDLLVAYMTAIKEMNPGMLIMGKRSHVNYHSTLAKNLLRNAEKDLLLIPSDSKCQLNKILVPVDFSPNSGRALQRAVALNKSLGNKAQIVCLNVYENPEVNMYKITRTYSQYEAIIKGNITDAFDSFMENFIPQDREAVSIEFVKKDLPGFGRYIMKYADKNEFDMIVMGTQGHSKAHYMFLGSTTEKVLNLTENIPIMVVK